MNTIKNTLIKSLFAVAIMLSLNSCFDESAPPGCEDVEKPVLSQYSAEVEEGESVDIPLPVKPDDETTIMFSPPNGLEMSTFYTGTTISNATQEMAGVYKIYYLRNYCKSEPALFTLKVIPPAVKCTLPDNLIRFPALGYDLKYSSVYCAPDRNNDNKISISGGNSQSDFDIFFGTTTKPTTARSYSISEGNVFDLGPDEVQIRILLGGSYYYAYSSDKKRLNITFENGKLVATFCDVTFSESLNLVGSGRFVCN